MPHSLLSKWCTALVGALLAFACTHAFADPPTRVARLSFVQGAVSFSPAADADAWVEAGLNRPMFTGDRLWTDERARAELELGTAVVRAAPQTSITILNIDDRISQFEVAEGRLEIRVRTLAPDETFEIDTPNLAFAITSAGHYEVDVDPQGDATVIAVRDGRGEVYGRDTSYLVNSGQWYRFYGTDLDNDFARIPPPDDFERWALARDARYDRAVSARYVSRGVIGYEDLDEYGTWTTAPEYGHVWIPRAVPADWAPYRDGHWAWIDPWGWTWIDDAPWGFAPFHYGRWARVHERWCWVPGPANVRPVYAPALVAFIGGENFSVSVSGTTTRGVAWFPLGPGEVYRPSYRVSRNYFTQVNVANTRVSKAYVTNIYARPAAAEQARYRFRQVPDAITAVPVNAFVEARPVARAAVHAGQLAQAVRAAPVLPAPVVAPARSSFIGTAPAAAVKPPSAVLQRQAVAKTQPPQVAPVFTPHDLNANAGHVVDAARRVRNAAPLRQPVRVVGASKAQAGATAPHRNAPGSAAVGAGPATPGAAPVGARRGPGAAAAPANGAPLAARPSTPAPASGMPAPPRSRGPNGAAGSPPADAAAAPPARPNAGAQPAPAPRPEAPPGRRTREGDQRSQAAPAPAGIAPAAPARVPSPGVSAAPAPSGSAAPLRRNGREAASQERSRPAAPAAAAPATRVAPAPASNEAPAAAPPPRAPAAAGSPPGRAAPARSQGNARGPEGNGGRPGVSSTAPPNQAHPAPQAAVRAAPPAPARPEPRPAPKAAVAPPHAPPAPALEPRAAARGAPPAPARPEGRPAPRPAAPPPAASPAPGPTAAPPRGHDQSQKGRGRGPEEGKGEKGPGDNPPKD